MKIKTEDKNAGARIVGLTSYKITLAPENLRDQIVLDGLREIRDSLEQKGYHLDRVRYVTHDPDGTVCFEGPALSPIEVSAMQNIHTATE